ncbi:hypothetical protein QTP86_012897 [Hemibagrus guttatus]|nr:hypothetical protein QTP86_012897 [Hemibagrus guttatus]
MERTEENRQEYKELQRRVKREVSKAKQKAYDELYTREGEKNLYRNVGDMVYMYDIWPSVFVTLPVLVFVLHVLLFNKTPVHRLTPTRCEDAASLPAEDGPNQTFIFILAGTRSASLLIGGGDRRPHLPPSLPVGVFGPAGLRSSFSSTMRQGTSLGAAARRESILIDRDFKALL